MKKIVSLFSFLFFLIFSNSLLAEVDIELLKKKYPKCENSNYRHECFDDAKEQDFRYIGYFRNNSLWDGQYFTNDILLFEYVNGEQFAKSFCEEKDDGWVICPSGNKYKPIDGGYTDSKGNNQGKFIVEFSSGNKFVGEHHDNKKHGKGTLMFANGDKYIGDFKNGLFHGQGAFTFANGNKDVGEWQNGALNGYAIQYYADGSIFREGIFKDDEFLYAEIREKTDIDTFKSSLPLCLPDQFHNCYGTFIFDDGDKYVGEWMDNKYHGQGTYTFADGDKYVGEFKDGKKHGQGTYYYLADNEFKGYKYIGEYKDDKRNGQGTMTYPDGDKYIGDWKDGKKHGQGTYYYLADNKFKGDKYVGEYLLGKRHGQGIYTFADGSKDVGEWKNDQPSGYAIRYNADGTIRREGIFKDGEFLNAETREKKELSKLDKYKSTCEEIGFTPGTEKFGDCVLKLMDKD